MNNEKHVFITSEKNDQKNDKKRTAPTAEAKLKLDKNCDSSLKRSLNVEKVPNKKQKIASENDSKLHTPKTLEDCQQIIKGVLKGSEVDDKNDVESAGNGIRIRKFDVNRIKSKTLKGFFSECLSDKVDAKMIEEEIKPRIDDVFANFKKTSEHFRKSKDFKQEMHSYTDRIRENPNHASLYFGLVADLFAFKALQEPQDIEIDRLANILDDLAAKIKSLRETEVDFDDDRNSVYMQEDFYTKKFCEAYKLWCEKTGESYYRNRTMFQRLNYNSSKYPEFNKAVNEMYRKKCRFPNFDLIDTVIRACAEQEKISIAEHELKHEIQTVFREVGKICQKRRINETNDSLGMYLGSSVDPALSDSVLDAKLKEQTQIGQKKLDEVFDFFVKKQLESAINTENVDNGEEDEGDDDDDDEEEEEEEEEEDNVGDNEQDNGEGSESPAEVNIHIEPNNEDEIVEEESIMDQVDNDGNSSPNSWLGDAVDKSDEPNLDDFRRMCDSILAMDNVKYATDEKAEAAKKSISAPQGDIFVLSD